MATRVRLKDVRHLMRDAGIAIRRPRTKKAPVAAQEAPRLVPGTLIAHGVVIGRPVPWKALRLGRRGDKDYAAFQAWKDRVCAHWYVFPNGVECVPYRGPVRLDVVFYRLPTGSIADRTNLLKSTEDGLQGVVIANDRQVKAGEPILIEEFDGEERAEIRVTAL